VKSSGADLILDSSAVVALVSTWHAQHQRVHDFIEGRLAGGDRLALASHSLVEAYSVLTRLPAPYRIAAAAAHELLEINFSDCVLLGLATRKVWQVLAECAEQGIGGGRIYDALIAHTARKGARPTLFTLNPKHFTAFGSADLTIASLQE
jgi:predicted nucleic acid-binding protein